MNIDENSSSGIILRKNLMVYADIIHLGDGIPGIRYSSIELCSNQNCACSLQSLFSHKDDQSTTMVLHRSYRLPNQDLYRHTESIFLKAPVLLPLQKRLQNTFDESFYLLINAINVVHIFIKQEDSFIIASLIQEFYVLLNEIIFRL